MSDRPARQSSLTPARRPCYTAGAMQVPSSSVQDKRLIVIMDGAADEPQPDLGGMTPLQAARLPHCDLVARNGVCGLARTIPEDMEPGSDVATLSILGYDPRRYHTGRAPLEAASMDVPLNAEDVAFRCNLVTSDGTTLIDYSAGEIPSDDARLLIGLINDKLATRRIQFYPGVSYRHIMAWRGGSSEVRTTPPHDIIGQPMEPHLPRGDGEEMLRRLMFDSMEILDSHDINKRRRDEGKAPANMIWLWGQGRKCELPSFALTRGMPGVVIAAVDLVRGVGKCAGLSAPTVPGATGNLETNFGAKAQAALDALDAFDFVVVHIEAPDEASHQASPERKIWAVEEIDKEVVGPLLNRLQAVGESRIMIICDHYTKIATKTHAREPVPFALLGPPADAAEAFDEENAAGTGCLIEEGWRLIDLLFEG